MKQLLITPQLSEKAVAQATEGVYMFNVPSDANKHEIAQAVNELYDVNVSEVRVLLRKGKSVRTHRGGGKFVNGRKKDIKKAYVRLQEGQTIPVFETTEEEQE